MSAVASIQLPTETALQTFLQNNLSGDVLSTYQIVAAHSIETLPGSGNYIAINAAPGDWEEYIDNATTHIEFTVATQVADDGTRPTRAAEHQQALGALQDLFSWQNFDAGIAELNAQSSSSVGITIGFSGYEGGAPSPDSSSETQLITALPYDFIVFIEAAESS